MSVEEELAELLSAYPVIDKNAECSITDQVRKINALLSCFMHIPFPESLDDDTWCEKFRQYEWLSQNNYLPIKVKE